MKIILQILIALLLFFSCKNEKTDTTNSLINKNINSEIKDREMIVKNNMLDFEEFYLKFMSDENFQKNSIVFPIFIKKQKISKKDWIYKPLFTFRDAIAEITSDTIIKNNPNKRNIMIIDLKKNSVNNYVFKPEKEWNLITISDVDFKEFDYSFLSFFKKFSSDINFQKKHINFPYHYIFSNSEKDYETDTVRVNKNNWKFMNLDIKLVQYENEINMKNDYRILSFSGIENGIAVNIIFKRIKGKWMLIEYNDFST